MALSLYRNLLFDLDGTLTDSAAGIVHSVEYALAKMGISEADRGALLRFIGPPLVESFQRFYGMDFETAWQAVQFYREYFGKTGIFENRVYPGISELLADLKRRDFRLAVATSKPTVFSERILVHFGLDQFFDRIIGSELDGSRSAKSDVVAAVLAASADMDPNRPNAAMIGDREHDIIGARNNGIAAIAVAYGYGTIGELTAARPDRIVHSVSELRDFLLGNPAERRKG